MFIVRCGLLLSKLLYLCACSDFSNDRNIFLVNPTDL